VFSTPPWAERADLVHAMALVSRGVIVCAGGATASVGECFLTPTDAITGAERGGREIAVSARAGWMLKWMERGAIP
jgi:hypothetical protein